MSARWAYNILDWLRRVWTFICSLTIFTSRSPGLPAHNLRSSAEKLEFVGNNYDDGSGIRQQNFLPHPSINNIRLKGKKATSSSSKEERRERKLAKGANTTPVDEYSDPRHFELYTPATRMVQHSLPRVIITPSTPSEPSQANWRGFNHPYSESISFVTDNTPDVSSELSSSSSSEANFNTPPTFSDNEISNDSLEVAIHSHEDFTAQVVSESVESIEKDNAKKDNGFVFTDSLTDIAFGYHKGNPPFAEGPSKLANSALQEAEWPLETSFNAEGSPIQFSADSFSQYQYNTSTPKLDGAQRLVYYHHQLGDAEETFFSFADESLRDDQFSIYQLAGRPKSNLQYADIFDFDMYADLRASMASMGKYSRRRFTQVPPPPLPLHLASSNNSPPLPNRAGIILNRQNMDAVASEYQAVTVMLPEFSNGAPISQGAAAIAVRESRPDPKQASVRAFAIPATSTSHLLATSRNAQPMVTENEAITSNHQNFYHDSIFPGRQLQAQTVHGGDTPGSMSPPPSPPHPSRRRRMDEIESAAASSASLDLPDEEASSKRQHQPDLDNSGNGKDSTGARPTFFRDAYFAEDPFRMAGIGSSGHPTLQPLPEKAKSNVSEEIVAGVEEERAEWTSSNHDGALGGRASERVVEKELPAKGEWNLDGTGKKNLEKRVSAGDAGYEQLGSAPITLRTYPRRATPPESRSPSPLGPRPLRVVNGPPPASNSSLEKTASEHSTRTVSESSLVVLSTSSSRLNVVVESRGGKRGGMIAHKDKENILAELRLIEDGMGEQDRSGKSPGRTAMLMHRVNRQAQQRRAGIFSNALSASIEPVSMNFDINPDASGGVLVFDERKNIFRLGHRQNNRMETELEEV